MRPEPRAAGNLFGRVDAIEADRCVSCGTQFTREQIGWWPDLTQQEYQRSGCCRRCQAVAFGEDLTVCTCASPCCEVDVGVGIMTCGGLHCPVHGLTDEPGVA